MKDGEHAVEVGDRVKLSGLKDATFNGNPANVIEFRGERVVVKICYGKHKGREVAVLRDKLCHLRQHPKPPGATGPPKALVAPDNPEPSKEVLESEVEVVEPGAPEPQVDVIELEVSEPEGLEPKVSEPEAPKSEAPELEVPKPEAPTPKADASKQWDSKLFKHTKETFMAKALAANKKDGLIGFEVLGLGCHRIRNFFTSFAQIHVYVLACCVVHNVLC